MASIRKQTKASQHPYPHFLSALRALGSDSPTLARVLGVSQRAAYNYLAGEALPRVEVVKRHPTIDLALTLDLSPSVPHLANSMQESAKNSS